MYSWRDHWQTCVHRRTFGIVPGLCCGLLLGQDFQQLHMRVIIEHGGEFGDFIIASKGEVACALPAADAGHTSLFPSLPQFCKPIAIKSRRFSYEDKEFIASKSKEWLTNDIIEECRSRWRTQHVVTKPSDDGHVRKRLCVDYSQTINKYTEMDAYPFPRIDDMMHQLASYCYFATFDLKPAYHQILIVPSQRKYTAFEANVRLFQFKRIPFGVTSGGVCFQRMMDKLIQKENLNDTFYYMDNLLLGIIHRANMMTSKNAWRCLGATSSRWMTRRQSDQWALLMYWDIASVVVLYGLIDYKLCKIFPCLKIRKR